MNNSLLEKIKPQQFIYGMVVLFFIYFSYLSLSQHLGLKTNLNDLGNMVQPLHNTIQGRFMQTSTYIIQGNFATSRFAIHANYILLLILPIFYFIPTPETLLVMQQLFFAAAAIPLFYLSAKVLKDKRLATIPPVLYLLNINIQDAALFDFHPIIILPLLLFSAYYFLEQKKQRLFYVMIFLIVLLKEDMALLTAMLGLYLTWDRKQKKQGSIVFVASLLFFAVNIKILMPYFSEGSGLVIVSDRYSHLGNGVIDIFSNIFKDPALFISSVLGTQKLIYVLILLLPFLFLPLFSWKLLILALPHIFINLLSSNPMTYQPFFFYHSLPIVSILVLSTVYSLERTRSSGRIRLALPVLVFALVYSLLLSPAPYSVVHDSQDYSYNEHSLDIKVLKQKIPMEASLSVQNNLGAHFAQRESVYIFPINKESVDYVLIDINDPFSEPKVYPRPYNFIYYSQMSMPVFRREITEMFENKDYSAVYYTDDGYLLFQRAGEEGKEGAKHMFEERIELLEQRYKDYDKYL